MELLAICQKKRQEPLGHRLLPICSVLQSSYRYLYGMRPTGFVTFPFPSPDTFLAPTPGPGPPHCLPRNTFRFRPWMHFIRTVPQFTPNPVSRETDHGLWVGGRFSNPVCCGSLTVSNQPWPRYYRQVEHWKRWVLFKQPGEMFDVYSRTSSASLSLLCHLRENSSPSSRKLNKSLAL